MMDLILLLIYVSKFHELVEIYDEANLSKCSYYSATVGLHRFYA